MFISEKVYLCLLEILSKKDNKHYEKIFVMDGLFGRLSFHVGTKFPDFTEFVSESVNFLYYGDTFR